MSIVRATAVALGIGLLWGLAALPSAHAQSGFAPIVLSTNGERPSIAVDEEGTAHVVWNESVSGGADLTHYCRVTRGSTSCTGEQTLVPPEDQPQYNTDTAGPRVVLTGPEDVAILTFRYPNVVFVNSQGSPDPDCFTDFPLPAQECYGSSSKTWIYRSTDGGNSFGAPHVFSHTSPSGEATVLHDANGPLIATVTDTVTGGTYFASAPPGGYARTSANVGDEGSDRALGGTVAALDGGTPVTAFNDLPSNLYVRQWGGTAPRNDIATWPAAQRVDAGEEPHLAGGPGGVFLLYRPRVDDLRGDRLVVRRWSNRALGSSVAVSDNEGVGDADLFEDDSGRLHAAWVRRGPSGDTLRYRFSPDGTSFSEPFPVGTAGPSAMWNVELGAAEDGGGFAVWSSTLSGNGQISIAPFGTQAKRVLVDARATAIEVTQGIQALDLPRRSQATSSISYSGVPLAAFQNTFVRVYANLRKPLPAGTSVPNMTLQAFRDGKPVSAAILPETLPPSLGVGAIDEVTDDQRYTPANAYTFFVPWQWAQGDVTLVAEINPSGLLPTLDECRICREDNVLRLTSIRFQPTTRLKVFPVEIDVGSVRPAGAPDLYGYFRRPGVEVVTPQPFDFAGTTPVVDAGPWLALGTVLGISQAQKEAGVLQRVRDVAAANGQSAASVYPFGVFPSGQGVGNGLTNGGPLYSSSQPASLGDDSRPLTSMAHEFHHGLGRVHADLVCGGNSNKQVGEAWPPNDDGALDGVGLDTRGAAPYRIIANEAPDTPDTLFDLMSYCPVGGVIEARDWMSVRNWTRAIELNKPAARAAHPGGIVVARPVAHAAAARSLRFYTVIAPDGPAGGTFVTPDDGAPTPVDAASAYTLVARAADGTDLATAGALVSPVHTHEGNVAIVAGRVAAAGAASVVLLENGSPIAQLAASKSAPKVAVLSPRRGARVGGKTVTVRWRASDADRDTLQAVVEYSGDGGRTWQAIHSGANAGRAKLPARLFTASRNARVRIRAQDGFHETVATSGRFASRGAAPLAHVITPAKGTSVAAGTSLALWGDAYDDKGAGLTGGRLVWRDGRRRIGTGERIMSAGLAPGRHRITLEARDRLGRRGRATVTVRVAAAAPQLTLLKAPARLSRRARSVRLQVAATFPSSLKAGGRRYAIGTRAKTIVVRVKPGRTLLALRLVLSAGGRRSEIVQQILR
jgi:hypothetical protein